VTIYYPRAIFIIVMTTFIWGCASTMTEEVACNFASGATYNTYEADSSGEENFTNSIFTGLLNIVYQGSHRAISPDTYNSCVQHKANNCMDSSGRVIKNCGITN